MSRSAYDDLVEQVARAMWNARYEKYKWDDPAGDDAYQRRHKKEGFRRTARAALSVVDAYLGMPVTEFPERQWRAGYDHALRLAQPSPGAVEPGQEAHAS